MSTIHFTATQQISLIRIHTYMHIHTGGRWWQRAVMAYIGQNIQIDPMLDEDLHHLQMAFNSGGKERGRSLLSETHTVRETPRHATTHYPHTDHYLYANIHTFTHTTLHIVYIFKDSCASICYYIHTYSMGIHTDCAYRDTSLLHTGDYLQMHIN